LERAGNIEVNAV